MNCIEWAGLEQNKMASVHDEREYAGPNGAIKDPLLDLIIQKYTKAARDSIRGPVALKADFKYFTHGGGRQQSIGMKPLQLELEDSQVRQTNVDGCSVACFNVGGEKRLCFTELVQVVLKEFNVQEIFKRRDELLIFCSKCTPQQLDSLKLSAVLPWTSTSSNLISKSDAYRLVGTLFGPRSQKGDTKRSPISFEVYHECFGGCIGVFDPELYHDGNSLCIRCTECNGMFSTKKFVSHNHMSFDEVHTCHWGFDSSRWRAYLMLVEQKPNRELLTLWASIKAKFDGNLESRDRSRDNQDYDFVSYIHSPEAKKALVSPIETLRQRESRDSRSSEHTSRITSEHTPRMTSESRMTSEQSRHASEHSSRLASEFAGASEDKKPDSSRSSAFHPWSPTPTASSSSSHPHRTAGGRSSDGGSHFLFDKHGKHGGKAAHASYPPHAHAPYVSPAAASSSCACTHNNPLSSSSPLYHGCQKCSSAAASAASNCSGLHMLAQKASEELDIKPKIESRDAPSACACDQCTRHPSRDCSRDSDVSRDSWEGCLEEVLMKCLTPELKLSTGPHELVAMLAQEMRRMSVKNDERVRELSISNQRLQTELHLVKSEYSKKLSEAMDTKAHLEQELEVVQRERQKDIVRYNCLTWEFTQEFEKHKHGSSDRAFERMQGDVRTLKHQLEQSNVDRDNLRKQLNWQLERHATVKMDVDKWTPFPTIGKKFSDSESDGEDGGRKKKSERKPHSTAVSTIKPTSSSSSSSFPASLVNNSSSYHRPTLVGPRESERRTTGDVVVGNDHLERATSNTAELAPHANGLPTAKHLSRHVTGVTDSPTHPGKRKLSDDRTETDEDVEIDVDK